VKIVAQESALLSEDFLRLQADPFDSVAQGVNVAVEPPTGPASRVAPTPPHFVYFAKGGGVNSFGLAEGLRCRQPYLLPIPRPFAFPRSRRNRADHASVGFGHHELRTLSGQNPVRLLILLAQDLFGLLRLLQRRHPHRAD